MKQYHSWAARRGNLSPAAGSWAGRRHIPTEACGAFHNSCWRDYPRSTESRRRCAHYPSRGSIGAETRSVRSWTSAETLPLSRHLRKASHTLTSTAGTGRRMTTGSAGQDVRPPADTLDALSRVAVEARRAASLGQSRLTKVTSFLHIFCLSSPQGDRAADVERQLTALGVRLQPPLAQAPRSGCLRVDAIEAVPGATRSVVAEPETNKPLITVSTWRPGHAGDERALGGTLARHRPGTSCGSMSNLWRSPSTALHLRAIAGEPCREGFQPRADGYGSVAAAQSLVPRPAP